MSEPHKIICYPVCNGDTTQIKLSNGKRIILDYCHTNDASDDSNPRIDLYAELKKDLAASKTDYFDVAAFTHADNDHICGFSDFFELRHASKYQGDDRTKINELWVPAAILLEEPSRDELSEEFAILRREARHRLLEGEGILVFSRPQLLIDWLEPKLAEMGKPSNARDHLFINAGEIVPTFSLQRDEVEFFTHSPFIKHEEDGDFIRNDDALVFNVRFQAMDKVFDYLHFGDASWEIIKDIVRITEYHNNLDRLEWDIYNTPHHCSYKSLSDEKGEKITSPKEEVAKLLALGKENAYIVCSSKPIPNTPAAYFEKQPPHIQARNSYESELAKIGGRRFLVTMEEPRESSPEPIVFEIEKNGISLLRKAITGAAAIITSRPPRAG